MNYNEQADEPNPTGADGMEEKRSVLSEGSKQSSVIDQERN
jgi:hypothetical protein